MAKRTATEDEVQLAKRPAFEWTAADDNMLRASLQQNGVPRRYVPESFRLPSNAKITNLTWDDIASRAGLGSDKPGYLCCFRFYGPLGGQLQGQ